VSEMPDLRDRLNEVRRAWATHVRTVVMKAPRERPDLLVLVLAAALIVIVLYAAAALQHV
jgi:hypothetical protein